MTSTIAGAMTLRQSLSFYVSADAQAIEACEPLADAVVVRGIRGPGIVAGMRTTGFEGAVLFDRVAYATAEPSVDYGRWMAAQAGAGADRLLTPGRWIEWDQSGDALWRAIETESKATATEPATTVLLALDRRWLSKGILMTLDGLRAVERPLALVLAHPRDPLSGPDAVNGLREVSQIPKLSLLRCDHGAIGALALGSTHASIGLRPADRHLVPPGKKGGGRVGDRSARVFVWPLMDWFTAANVASWATVRANIECHSACCGGDVLSRFLDERTAADADRHNRTVIAGLADLVINEEPFQRRRLFAKLCFDAVERYGYMGKLSIQLEPKAQLVQWAALYGG